VAAWFGHANAAVVQTIYAHRLKGPDTAAASIGRLFDDPASADVQP
jgi:hypothetical protein